MLIKILVCHVAVSLSFAIYASELSLSQTCEDEGHLVQGNSPAVERIDSTANELYLGQDAAIESFGLQIRLGEKDDMIYPNLLWHYRMGCRNFEIIHQGLSESQAKKVKMFHERVKDICSLNTISVPKESEFISTLPESLKWILAITDRQILCLHKPLAEILSENGTLSLSLPSCEYSGFDPEAPVSFWPQTDERLIYRTPIDYEQSITLLNRGNSGDIRSNSAHVANFVTMEEAVPFTSEMMQDQLPFMEVIKNSIQHACLRGKSYWESSFIPAVITENLKEQHLSEFIGQFGHNENIHFGNGYIYVGVPKCGWSTMLRALGSLEANRVIAFEAYRGLSRIFEEVPERYQLLCGKSYIITCVRNPFDRILSGFLDKILFRKEDDYRQIFGFDPNQEIHFVDFLKKLKELPQKEIEVHFRPQYCLTMLPAITFAKIVHLENFNQEFQEVMNDLGIPGEPNDYKAAGHATHAAAKLSEYYTSECVSLLQEIYDEDFKILGYSNTPHFTIKS